MGINMSQLERLKQACEIFQKYVFYDYPMFAEHDVIGFCVDKDMVPEEDRENLDRLRIFYSYDYGAYIMYV